MTVRRALTCLVAAVVAATAALLGGVSPASAASGKRVVIYYQTQYTNGTYVSPLGLTDHATGATDLLIGAFHLNSDGSVHLNDDPPGDPKFSQMWTDVAAMQAKGVHAIGMVGGAAAGSFQRLDTAFSTYYPLLKNVVSTYHLNGLDLDVEESMSLGGIEHLIDQLHTDFGAGFIVTLAPVATALSGGGNLSGFSYDQLYRDRASSIAWFNAQFYCGWGSLSSTSGYDAIIAHGVVPADKVVAGTLTNPANCGSGYVDPTTLNSTLSSLTAKYPTFGGVAGWEYFNSLPGGTSAPWQWAASVSSAMNGGSTGPTDLALNKSATGSTPCNSSETPDKAVNGSVSGGNSDKFCSLSSPAQLTVDLGASHALTGLEIDHASAGGESASWNTRAYTVQVSTDGTTWTTVAQATANTAGVTTHTLSGTSGRYVRLNVTTPTQTTDPATRIYELKVFG
ncbi:discoidin domain-containing protein [Actinacidiphila acididurans]|uniref:Discoidin domain-containing protein n=1 Tax=Actinacidiphila acididurans TaxID=2784346 RepID=A0ABS2U3C4_9ACTN|nr:discoidin domain-containing protein [Actinacidiphila acididurans]MBM9510109.1 discoidin domain-containing protein [Actinacidiphila acididurans]